MFQNVLQMRMQSQANLVPIILMRFQLSDEAADIFRYNQDGQYNRNVLGPDCFYHQCCRQKVKTILNTIQGQTSYFLDLNKNLFQCDCVTVNKCFTFSLILSFHVLFPLNHLHSNSFSQGYHERLQVCHSFEQMLHTGCFSRKQVGHRR